MSEAENIKTPNIVALIGASNEDVSGLPRASATTSILGQPLISRQISMLHQLGVKQFVVAIDSVPGVLLALADQLNGLGIAIDFIRTPQELLKKLESTDLFFVQAEGVMADHQLLEECLAVRTPYIATVDNREENQAFESIDLNTAWAGLAVFSAETVSQIGDIPDDWNIISSLVRHAVTQKIHRRPIPQSLVQSSALTIVSTQLDANIAEQLLLERQKSKFDGWIETKIFNPIAKRIFPLTQRHHSFATIFDLAPGFMALAALVSAAAKYQVLPLSLGLLSLFLLNLRDLTKIYTPFLAPSKIAELASYALLALAAGAMIAQAGSGDVRFGIVALAAAGLIAVANKVSMKPNAAAILRSPAAFALIMLAGTVIFDPVDTVLVILLVQVSILLFALRE